MGFVADTNGSTTETLYVIDGTGSGGLFGGESAGLGKIDTTTLTLSGVGQFNGGLDGRSAEVTGRGDGKLFGFFVDTAGLSAPSVAEIDKSNANVISNVTQNGLASSISAWAFAHWGGSFYMFNAGSGQTASQVNKYTPASGTTPAKMELVVPSVTADGTPVRIVGAGVSTCAPTEEPIELSPYRPRDYAQRDYTPARCFTAAPNTRELRRAPSVNQSKKATQRWPFCSQHKRSIRISRA